MSLSIPYPLLNVERDDAIIGAMLTIRNIAIHHAGGTKHNRYASTAHLTFDDIEHAHRTREDWIGYRAHKSRMGFYTGYNAVYDPKTRAIRQARQIGEETLAQRRFNFNTFSLCIIGNFTMKRDGRGPVDPMTIQIEEDVTRFLHDLINGNKGNLQIAEGATLDLSINRVRPHRFYQSTECYGTALKDNHFRTLLINYEPVVVTAPDGKMKETLQERAALMRTLMLLTARLQDLIARVNKLAGRLAGKDLGSAEERSCDSTIN